MSIEQPGVGEAYGMWPFDGHEQANGVGLVTDEAVGLPAMCVDFAVNQWKLDEGGRRQLRDLALTAARYVYQTLTDGYTVEAKVRILVSGGQTSTEESSLGLLRAQTVSRALRKEIARYADSESAVWKTCGCDGRNAA